MSIIKYASQNIHTSDIKHVSKTLKDEFLTQGPKVQEFESKLKKKIWFQILCSNFKWQFGFKIISKIFKFKKR